LPSRVYGRLVKIGKSRSVAGEGRFSGSLSSIWVTRCLKGREYLPTSLGGTMFITLSFTAFSEFSLVYVC